VVLCGNCTHVLVPVPRLPGVTFRSVYRKAQISKLSLSALTRRRVTGSGHYQECANLNRFTAGIVVTYLSETQPPHAKAVILRPMSDVRRCCR